MGTQGCPRRSPSIGAGRDVGMHRPSSGFGHVSKFLGFSDAKRVGNPKAEVWGGFFEEEELLGEVGLCPGGMSVPPSGWLGGVFQQKRTFGKGKIFCFKIFLKPATTTTTFLFQNCRLSFQKGPN